MKILICILALVTAIAAQTCPPNFLYLGNRCYYFSRVALTWHEAQKYCTTFNPTAFTVKLASIESAAEQRLLEQTLYSRPDLYQHSYWISGNRIDNRLGWLWAGRGNRPMVYTHWAPNEPSGNGVCMHMWRERSYRWDDTDCDVTDVRFICETYPTS